MPCFIMPGLSHSISLNLIGIMISRFRYNFSLWIALHLSEHKYLLGLSHLSFGIASNSNSLPHIMQVFLYFVGFFQVLVFIFSFSTIFFTSLCIVSLILSISISFLIIRISLFKPIIYKKSFTLPFFIRII
ncbi:hypothetical protein ES705_47372 [subsurface metagenome]